MMTRLLGEGWFQAAITLTPDERWGVCIASLALIVCAVMVYQGLYSKSAREAWRQTLARESAQATAARRQAIAVMTAQLEAELAAIEAEITRLYAPPDEPPRACDHFDGDVVEIRAFGGSAVRKFCSECGSTPRSARLPDRA
jgi:hypothetical protein